MITLKEIKYPLPEQGLVPVVLSDETIKQRKEKILQKMNDQNFDVLFIYADLEHGGNFEYLTGFVPRFEEALLVLHKNGNTYIVLGNENLNKASKARIAATPIHMPHFSLPNQPMNTKLTVWEILNECRIEHANKIGLVGWKLFTQINEPDLLTEIPHYIIEAIKKINDHADLQNATHLFIGEKGVRTTNNANEFAHYEFGAALAGNCMLQAMQAIEEGMSEMEIAQQLDAYGQTHNVVTIMAAGERFVKANMYPSDKKIQKGERISMTTGYKGGLQSRCGYAVSSQDELPDDEKDYLKRVAIPYFYAVKTWLETIHIGMKGGTLYQAIEDVFPKQTYGWTLNPGHLCADEEWLSSPIYESSTEELESGMLLQIDIIPSVPGYGGISCESGVLLADENLRLQLQNQYPEIWLRIQQRQIFMRDVLGIQICDDVLPTSIATALCNPFLLHKGAALVVE